MSEAAEVETLLGDARMAKNGPGGVPGITLDPMVREMVEGDLEAARQHALLRLHGHSVSVSKED